MSMTVVKTAARASSGRATRLCVLLALLLLASSVVAHGSPEAEYERSVARLSPVDVVSGPQVQQARRAGPGRPLQLSGVIRGLMVSGDKRIIILSLIDQATVEIESREEHSEIRTGARVRCLVQPADSTNRSRLDLVDITYDRTPIELLAEAARAALKIPPQDPREIALSAAQIRGGAAMPSRGGDPTIVCRRAIAHFNPRLSTTEVNTMADNIIRYSTQYGVDPYLVVAVIAAESRFNPNARSYAGAMGLGQLMPATAAAHGVDAYDPVANLHTAVRIIRRNLDTYNGDWNRALAAYNAGRGAVNRYGGVPPYRETRDYLWRIYEYWSWLNGVTPQARPR